LFRAKTEFVAKGEPFPKMDPQSGQKLLLTISEAAFLLGMGRSFVYELVLKGEIPSIKLGRARRVPAAALEQFVASRLAMDEDGEESSLG
jgi:excisionase family DNA binding protein